jgi:CheY-like chemotaxis protein/archaellum biogenesis ATPase FlaH
MVSLRRSGVPVVDRVIGGLAPGLPLVIAGPPGCGRTVLSLQLAAAALADSDIVAFLSGEPAALLLRQAESLGLALESHVSSGQLLLLELDPRAPASLQAAGGKALVESIRVEHPSVSLIVIDPFTALTSGLVEEAPLRALARDLIAATPRTTLVLTVETERAGADAPVERVLAEVCGTLLTLGRRQDGRRTLRVTKTRAGAGAAEALEFRIGANGAEVVREVTAELETVAAPRAASPPAVRPAAAASPPAAETAARSNAEAPPKADPPRQGPAQILVVDGDEPSRVQLIGLLEERYRVTSAADGFEAITAIASENPDAIVLSLEMPRLSGYQVITAIHRVCPSARILAITGSLIRGGDRLAPLVLGAADVIARPVQPFELQHKLETLLRLAGPPTRLIEPAEAHALFGVSSRERLISSAAFRERLGRAADFGERFGVPSTLLALEAPSTDLLDHVISLADDFLRFEDAVLVVSKRRALILLIAAELAQGGLVMERLHGLLAVASGSEARLHWRASDARAAAGLNDWKKLFAEIDEASP